MSDELIRLLPSLRVFVTMFFLAFFVFAMTEFRYSKKSSSITIAVVSILCMTANAFVLMNYGATVYSNVVILTTTLPELITLLILTKDNFVKSWFNFWFQVNILCVVWLITGYAYLFFNIGIIADIIIRIIMFSFVMFLFMKYLKKPYRMIMNSINKGWIAIFFVPIFFVYIFFHDRFLPSAENQSLSQLIFCTVVIALMLIVYYIIYRAFKDAYDEMIKKQIEQKMKSQIAFQKEQFEVMQEKIQEDKILRHDIRHHSLAMIAMLNKGEFDKIKEYAEHLSDIILNNQFETFCENSLVNAILSAHINVARKKNIKVDSKVIISNKLKFDETELCVIISNLLENAVESCYSKMDILIVEKSKQLCINVKNDYEGHTLKDENGSYISTKISGSGIGLKSVKSIIEKYNGIMEITDVNNNFRVRIVIKI